MKHELYKSFEDKFRGAESSIKERLTVYLPFIKPLFELYPQEKALDIGCGRGEWLALLAEHNIKAFGLDLNPQLILHCQQNKLDVQAEDALDFLQKQEANSWLLITGFHVIEHLTFEVQQKLIREAYRVLCPGGLLILETPNPDNLRVASLTFWLDPTHNSPLPQELLSFLIDERFDWHKILGLNEDKFDLNNIRLSQIYSAVSPDYAIVAQKKGNDKAMLSNQNAFDLQYGCSFTDVLSAYERKIDEDKIKLEQQLSDLQGQLKKLQQSFKLISFIKYFNPHWYFKKNRS